MKKNALETLRKMGHFSTVSIFQNNFRNIMFHPMFIIMYQPDHADISPLSDVQHAPRIYTEQKKFNQLKFEFK